MKIGDNFDLFEGIMTEKDELVQRAKLAEQAERYFFINMKLRI